MLFQRVRSVQNIAISLIYGCFATPPESSVVSRVGSALRPEALASASSRRNSRLSNFRIDVGKGVVRINRADAAWLLYANMAEHLTPFRSMTKQAAQQKGGWEIAWVQTKRALETLRSVIHAGSSLIHQSQIEVHQWMACPLEMAASKCGSALSQLPVFTKAHPNFVASGKHHPVSFQPSFAMALLPFCTPFF